MAGPGCKLHNVSTTRQAKFMTERGDVIVEQVSAKRWSIRERGRRPFTITGKTAALTEACRIQKSRRY